ncbi:hypothetical protein [Streptomyces genisteinicus]|uniref:Lipoprotein n=1 Tax=Streptomyces genisteinicus TaxID=2768068 RepID=A0A7H0HWW7_9ACTN|nr:hypothetical protein [Streptomyces genisteinicus]QNP65033.1 hypothetical protein IAG43_20340 [Streptomyces genisteinicus]
MSSAFTRTTCGGARRRGPRRGAFAAGLAALALLVTACGDDPAGATVPDGWQVMRTDSVEVARPASFTEQGPGERGTYNAAAAVLEEGGRTVAVITVQLGFTNARTPEQAAIGAEAGIALGATVEGQRGIRVAGGEQVRDAKRIDFAFTASGEAGGPAEGTRVDGVIVAGLDSAETAYAVRVDSAEGALSDADVRRIVESIAVK